MKDLVVIIYFACLAWVALYGIHIYWLLWLHWKGRNATRKNSHEHELQGYPHVTVQLPVYNEKRVAGRLLKAAASLDWPRDKLQIQILDDSDDDTTRILADETARLRELGVNVEHIRRPDRDGYKAGALAFGMNTARGEFVAVFDADNVPRSSFLRQTIPEFEDARVGMVQARWSFLNRSESVLCRAQALYLDAHFYVEQAARNSGGLFMNFNGTAGVWRKIAIEEAGGWQFDTLTEDLDLSYRAQMTGWQMRYLDHVDVPSELPGSIRGFKSQQYRWARGAIETARKILPRVVRSRLPWKIRLASCFHLTQKTVSLALGLLSLLLIPALYFRIETGWLKVLVVDLPIFLAGTGSMTLFYGAAWKRSRETAPKGDKYLLPALTSIGIGLAVNNSLAVLSGLLSRERVFVRTPKSGSDQSQKQAIPRTYRIRTDRTVWVESLLALYAGAAAVFAFQLDLYFTVPFMFTFAFGYSYLSVLSWRESYA